MPQQYDEPTIQAKLDAAVEWILSQEEYHCPPEDGREDWEPWEFDLMEQLMRGCQSLRIPVEYVLFFDGKEVQMHSKALNEHRLDCVPVVVATPTQITNGAEVPPSIPAHHRRVVYALCPCERDVIGVPMAQLIQHHYEHSDLKGLLMLADLHTETFLNAAAQRFSEIDTESSRVFEGDYFLSLIVTLARSTPDSLRELIERTIQLDSAAGRRLQTAAIETLSNPRVSDLLGWLETGRLVEELERQ